MARKRALLPLVFAFLLIVPAASAYTYAANSYRAYPSYYGGQGSQSYYNQYAMPSPSTYSPPAFNQPAAQAGQYYAPYSNYANPVVFPLQRRISHCNPLAIGNNPLAQNHRFPTRHAPYSLPQLIYAPRHYPPAATPYPASTPTAYPTPSSNPLPTATPGPSPTTTSTPLPSATPTATPSPAPTTTPTPKTRSFDVRITHSGGYSPAFFSVNHGDTVVFRASTDFPSHMHGITISGFGVNLLVTSTDPAQPDQTSFTASQSGTFTITCGTCGSEHFGLGGRAFTGTLQVN